MALDALLEGYLRMLCEVDPLSRGGAFAFSTIVQLRPWNVCHSGGWDDPSRTMVSELDGLGSRTKA
jgi:hypothetical protein